ncbi:hypothetical protein BHM03_00004208 [Ensete ventricosum]|uniref:Uncharacterized protein n=1 Tax=Ensete ventricosum TaxID=4639 RepID=A0A445MAH4_ENSVE|nr:hypothetical protein BHM03_00004208 [Ensete ventricosum]
MDRVLGVLGAKIALAVWSRHVREKISHPRLMKDLCQTRAQSKDESFLALHMSKLPDRMWRHLKEARARVRSMKDELLEISWNLEVTHSKTREAEGTLSIEFQKAPKKAKEVIAAYKESSSSKLGPQRSSQVFYEYGYRVVLARFQAKYPDLDIKENLFTSLMEDNNVPMEEEVPFDDSLSPP